MNWRFFARFRGLVGVLLVFFTLCVLHANVVQPYRPYDEPAHVAYAYILGGGELPTLETRLPVKPIGLKKRPRRNIWTANHPPLYYALVAPIIRYGSAHDASIEAVRWARLVSMLLACLGICYVHALLRRLKPGDEVFALLGTTVTALIPGFVHVSALVHNDALAFLTTAATMHAALGVVRRGPGWRHLLPLMLWATLAVWTRASGLMTLGIAVAAAGFGGLWHPRGGWLVRGGKGLLASAAVGGTALASIAWFFLRNRELHGDLFGAKRGLELFHRKAGPTPWRLVTSEKFWDHLQDQLWGRFAGGVLLQGGIPELGTVLWFLAAAGGALFLWRQRRWLTEPRQLVVAAKSLPAQTAVAWALQFALLSALVASIVWFHSKGGSAHTRYVFPGMWTLTLLAVPGWLALRSRMAWSMVTLQLVLLNTLAVIAYADQLYGKAKHDAMATALKRSDVQSPGWFFALCFSAIVIGTLLILDTLNAPSPDRHSADAEA